MSLDPYAGIDFSERVKPLMQQVVLLDQKRMEEIGDLRRQLAGAVSDVARARGLAEALAKCPDDHTVKGVREVGAEIAALLSRVGGQ